MHAPLAFSHIAQIRNLRTEQNCKKERQFSSSCVGKLAHLQNVARATIRIASQCFEDEAYDFEEVPFASLSLCF